MKNLQRSRRAGFVILTACFALSAQTPTPVAPRLRDVRTVYVGSFGTGQGADLIRAKVITNIVKSARLEVVEVPEGADAVLTGTGELSKTESYEFSAGPQGGQGHGGTKDHATAAVRLIRQADHKILWADEASTGIFALRSATSSAADGIVKKLLAAIENDRK